MQQGVANKKMIPQKEVTKQKTITQKEIVKKPLEIKEKKVKTKENLFMTLCWLRFHL
jgi:hypothetical protein